MLNWVVRGFGAASMAVGVWCLQAGQPFLGVGAIFLGFVAILFTMSGP